MSKAQEQEVVCAIERLKTMRSNLLRVANDPHNYTDRKEHLEDRIKSAQQVVRDLQSQLDRLNYDYEHAHERIDEVDALLAKRRAELRDLRIGDKLDRIKKLKEEIDALSN